MTDYRSGPWTGTPQFRPQRPCPFCAEPILADAVLCRWCGHRLNHPTSMSSTARRFAAAIGLAAGGLVIGISPILPWLRILLFGDANLFDAARLAHGGVLPVVLLPMALVICGATAIVAAVVLREGVAAQVTAFVLFGVAGVLGGLLLVGLLTTLSGASGLAHLGLGPWVELAGALLVLAGAVVPPQTRSPQSHSTGRTVFSSVACGIALAVAALGLTAMARVGGTNHATATDTTTTPDPSSAEPVLPEPPASPEPATAEPAVPPATSQPSVSSLAEAETVVWGKGYRPYPNTTWERTGGLQVILGTIIDSADGYANRAFFFLDGRYLGTDTSVDSAGIQEVWSDGDTVALTYELYHADDPQCCPTAGAATVRYHWTGSHLTPLDPIPRANPAADPSRR